MSKATFNLALFLIILGGLVLAVWQVGAHGGQSARLQPAPGIHLEHHMHHAHQLIRQLELSDEQQAHVQTIHETLLGVHERLPEVHTHLLETSLARLEAGYTDPFEVRQQIDQHLEHARHTAYSVADQWVALGNSLDPSQRETLRAHLEAALAMSNGEAEEKRSWLSQLHGRIHGHFAGHGH